MDIEIHNFSKKLRDLRQKKNLTQEMLAKELGVSRQSIISIEQGKCMPSLPLALSLFKIFETPFEDIFEINFPQLSGRREKTMTHLTPFSPMREVSSLHEAIDRLFEENLPSVKGVTIPSMNILERNGAIVVQADVPGLKEEDINIEVGEDTLTISGERKKEEEISEEDYYHKEVSHGYFERTVVLPAVVDIDKTEAKLKNGTLTVTLPKREKLAPKTTKIKVKTTEK